MVKFENHGIGFAAVNAWMLEQEFIEPLGILVTKPRFSRGVACDVRRLIAQIMLAIVCALAWPAIVALVAVTLVASPAFCTGCHGATIRSLHDNPMAQFTRSARLELADLFLRREALYPIELRAHALALAFLRIARAGDVLEQIKLVIDQPAIELAHAVRVTEEIRPGIRQVVAGAVRHVMGDLDLFHLIAVDGMRTKVARNG